MKQSPAERLFNLTCCLLASPIQGLSKRDLFNAVSSYAIAKTDAARDQMFERDKDFLRDAGVQVEVVFNDSFEDINASRYRIAPGSFDWPSDFSLNPAQLQLLELAAKAWNNQLMSASARSGITRLRSLGLVTQSENLGFFSPKLLTRHASFAPLAQAIDDNLAVKFEYQKLDGEKSIRLLEPLKLRMIEGQWVLLASDAGVIKNFLLRRISSLVDSTRDVFVPANAANIALAEADLVAFAKSNLAVIEVLKESEAWWHFGAPEHSKIELHFMDEGLIAQDLMEFGGQLRVLSPKSLAERIAQGFKRVVESHA